MITSIEYCPVCKQMRELEVRPMKLPIMLEEHSTSTGKSRKGQQHTWSGIRIGTVKAWVVCSDCQTVLRSIDELDALYTKAEDLEVK